MDLSKTLYIFDLDDTLVLWSVDPSVRYVYEQRIKKCLEHLKVQGKVLALATFNTQPSVQLRRLQVYHLFDIVTSAYHVRYDEFMKHGAYREDNEIWFEGEKVRVSKTKVAMIQEILSRTSCSEQDSIFFDDCEENLKQVNQRFPLLHVVQVDPVQGIDVSNVCEPQI